MTYTKKQQTKWKKSKDPKNLPPKELRAFKTYIGIKTKHICQICNKRLSAEYHHALYGAYKDDRTLVAICRHCHSDIHVKGDKEKRSFAELVGGRNWEEFKEMK